MFLFVYFSFFFPFNCYQNLSRILFDVPLIYIYLIGVLLLLVFPNKLLSRVLIRKDARLLRDVRLIAYFRQIFPSDGNISTIKELARALCAHPPYQIHISDVKIKHMHCQVNNLSSLPWLLRSDINLPKVLVCFILYCIVSVLTQILCTLF